MGFEYGMIFGLTLTLRGFGMRAEVSSGKGGDLHVVAGVGLAVVGSRYVVER